MSSSIKIIAFIAATALCSACSKGPNEKAGEAADAAAGQSFPGEGPKEELGEKVDELQKDVAKEKSDMKELDADKVRTKAESQADAMENKADSVRDKADKKADTMEDAADKTRP